MTADRRDLAVGAVEHLDPGFSRARSPHEGAMTVMEQTSLPNTMRDVVWDIELAGLPLHGRTWERAEATSLLVLMPSAVDRTSPFRHPSYARWQWADLFPDCHVVALADPVMGAHPRLQGAWYMHPHADVLRAMAGVTAELADRFGASRILAYGSSLGGFGALGLAAMLPNAGAIAEVPQLDFGRWGPEAREDLQDYVLGCDLETHRARHPEQVSVRARFELEGRVPPYTIVTNVQEQGFAEQVEFHRWVSEERTAPLREGRHELRVVDDVLGHRPLGSARAAMLIQEHLTSTPVAGASSARRPADAR